MRYLFYIGMIVVSYVNTAQSAQMSTRSTVVDSQPFFKALDQINKEMTFFKNRFYTARGKPVQDLPLNEQEFLLGPYLLQRKKLFEDYINSGGNIEAKNQYDRSILDLVVGFKAH